MGYAQETNNLEIWPIFTDNVDVATNQIMNDEIDEAERRLQGSDSTFHKVRQQ